MVILHEKHISLQDEVQLGHWSWCMYSMPKKKQSEYLRETGKSCIISLA